MHSCRKGIHASGLLTKPLWRFGVLMFVRVCGMVGSQLRITLHVQVTFVTVLAITI